MGSVFYFICQLGTGGKAKPAQGVYYYPRSLSIACVCVCVYVCVCVCVCVGGGVLITCTQPTHSPSPKCPKSISGSISSWDPTIPRGSKRALWCPLTCIIYNNSLYCVIHTIGSTCLVMLQLHKTHKSL